MVSTLSGEYGKAARSVATLAQKYNESVQKTGKASSETKNLKAMLAQAEAQLKATASALRSANNGMDEFAKGAKTSGESLSGAMTKANFLSGVIQSLASAALSAAKGFIQSGIDYNAQIESYTVGFTNMLGSAEAAQQAIDQIQQDAARTPFSVDALTQANQLLIGAGENATYAEKTIMALGNAVSATGGGNAELSRMAANLQQIANVGKASAIDIKQFAYAGINIYGLLADYTGKSTAEVQKMTISYDLLTQALQAASEEGGRYYGSMDTQSQTMNGRVSTLQDNVKQLAGLLTGDLSSGVGVVIGNLNDMLVAAQEAYKTDGWIGLAGAITGLTEPINAAKNAFKDFASKATTWLDQLSYKLNRFLGKAATAGFDTYEEYADANNRQSNRNRLRQNALNGVGISNKSWSERQAELAAAAGNGGSSITTSPSSAAGKKRSSGSKSTTETVISSISSTATTTAQNALGTVTTSIQTLTEKVKDSSGKIKDRITETTTTTGKEMVNGVATTFKQVETKVNGTVTKTTKVYEDASKTLLSTLTGTTTKTVAGITTAIQRVTEKYADGSEHIKETQTETGQKIVDGVAQTYTKVTTYVDGFVNDVKESFEEVDRSWKATQERIENSASGISTESSKGIFGIAKKLVSGLKNQDWSSVGEQVFLLMWGEVDQGQRETLTNWALDSMKAINEAYAGGGLQSGLQAIADLFANGIVPSASMASKEVASFAKIMEGLSTSGGIGGVLGNLGTSLGGIASSLSGVASTVISFVASNPWVLAIAAIAAGAAGLGIFIWHKYGKKKEAVTSSYESPYSATPVYDSLSEFSTRAAMITRYTTPVSGAAATDKQANLLEQIKNMLGENLPNIGKGTVVLDGDKVGDMLSPRMATNIDARIGVTVQRNGRGV
nr:MAG TPA: tail tape measure protein [Caudoviricetes sp.]